MQRPHTRAHAQTDTRTHAHTRAACSSQRSAYRPCLSARASSRAVPWQEAEHVSRIKSKPHDEREGRRLSVPLAGREADRRAGSCLRYCAKSTRTYVNYMQRCTGALHSTSFRAVRKHARRRRRRLGTGTDPQTVYRSLQRDLPACRAAARSQPRQSTRTVHWRCVTRWCGLLVALHRLLLVVCPRFTHASSPLLLCSRLLSAQALRRLAAASQVPTLFSMARTRRYSWAWVVRIRSLSIPWRSRCSRNMPLRKLRSRRMPSRSRRARNRQSRRRRSSSFSHCGTRCHR